jgi:hypothetical protein
MSKAGLISQEHLFILVTRTLLKCWKIIANRAPYRVPFSLGKKGWLTIQDHPRSEQEAQFFIPYSPVRKMGAKWEAKPARSFR